MKSSTFETGLKFRDSGHLFSNYKRNISVWNLPIKCYRKKRKSYLRGKFQFVLFLIQVRYSRLSFFSRGPRTPYRCTRFREVFRHTFKQIVIVLKVRKNLFRLGFTWYTMLRQIPLTHEFMLQFAPTCGNFLLTNLFFVLQSHQPS